MFITWQGRGPIALIALIIPMALMTIGLLVFLRLEEIGPLAKATLVCAPMVVGSVLAGGVCYRYGRRLNKDQNIHTLYGIPLQHWALIYWSIAAGGIVLFLAGLIHAHGP
jgi:hypothetical protein